MADFRRFRQIRQIQNSFFYIRLAHRRSTGNLEPKANARYLGAARLPAIGWANCGSRSQGKKIQVSWLTSVM